MVVHFRPARGGWFVKRSLMAILSTAAMIFAGVFTVAQPAQAYPYSNVYVSFPTWLANCPSGGNVIGINAAVGNIWVTPAGGDWGDDLVYPKVELYANNTISAQNYCDRPWYQGGGYWAPAVQVTFYPTRTGQTFWVGPAGQSHN
jgi:hypothetical protein